jgi:alkanesulfonate monooxygenase SsuD/methylene tetrahydromethanopterin reductase-like flavin-dependent oxidoreductase (luciferase family)
VIQRGLDVATDVEWSDPRLLVDLAVEAERAGWDGFFVWDILLAEDNAATPIADPWVTLGAIAQATARIRIGAMVTPLPRRRPWDVAREVATLDRLSEGRVVFGAGLGWQAAEFARFGEEADLAARATALDEGLEIVSRAWTGEPVSFSGTRYQVDGAILLPTPLQRPRPPIWLAAGWPRRRPLERAARWDGVLVMTEHQERHDPITAGDVREVVDAVKAYRGDLAGFDIGVNVLTSELGDAEAAAAVEAMADAGATWVIELTPLTVDAHRALIARGPLPGSPPGRVSRPG